MIRYLQEDVKSSIRTGVALTCIAQAVEELVLNAIDAGATSIAVRLDLSCHKVQVIDNGFGISEDQFGLIGERFDLFFISMTTVFVNLVIKQQHF